LLTNYPEAEASEPVSGLFRVQGSPRRRRPSLSPIPKIWLRLSGEAPDFSSGSRHEPIGAASGSEEVHGQEAPKQIWSAWSHGLFDCLELRSTKHEKNILNANRVVIGTLRGFDQFMNLVVDNTVEVNGNEKNDIGMVVIRGNSVVMIEALEPVAKPQ
ncbi:U6 snRNA-associated Sm-like protein LSm7, partial [Oryza brachyantha]|uniref:U6 snRNA-associated Sm-like protein LSm7 n=1 Tax=Oryza brachyantha TaxID=4533 RepID=UPI0007769916